MYKFFFFIFVLETRRKHYPHLVSSFRDDVEAGSGVFPEQGVVRWESFLVRLQDVIVDGALTRGIVTVYHTIQQRQNCLLQNIREASLRALIPNSAILLHTRLVLKPYSHQVSAMTIALLLLDRSKTCLNFDTSTAVDSDTDIWCEWCNKIFHGGMEFACMQI